MMKYFEAFQSPGSVCASWTVGGFQFRRIELDPRHCPEIDRLWFVFSRGTLLRAEGFETLEEAMRYASRPSGAEPEIERVSSRRAEGSK